MRNRERERVCVCVCVWRREGGWKIAGVLGRGAGVNSRSAKEKAGRRIVELRSRSAVLRHSPGQKQASQTPQSRHADAAPSTKGSQWLVSPHAHKSTSSTRNGGTHVPFVFLFFLAFPLATALVAGGLEFVLGDPVFSCLPDTLESEVDESTRCRLTPRALPSPPPS